MDLPTCPACGQSVLDDDVDDCPFCGASLKTGKASGKPAARPAAKAAAKSPAASAARSAGSAAKPAAASATPPAPRLAPRRPADSDDELAPPSDDDPFQVDTSAAEAAIRLRPAPAKGLSLKLTCPMCETVGYASSKAAGQQVRCANSKCLVPVFTAPAPKVEKPAEPPPPRPRRISAATLTMVLLLFVAVGGVAAAWQLGLLSGGRAKPPGTIPQDIKDLLVENEPPTPVNPETVNGGNGGAVDPSKPPEPEKTPLDELAREAPVRMTDLARLDQPERGKATARRMTGEAYALLGQLDEARQQVDQLAKVGVNMPFYRIPPLVAMGWQDWLAGRGEAALAVANEAHELSKQIPPFGRDPMEIAIGLAAYLAATGRFDEAEALVRTRDKEAELALLAGPTLHARATRTFDLEAALAERPVLHWSSPHWAAVAQLLADRGQWPAALAWSRRHPDLEGRTECLVAVAAHPAANAATISAAISDLPAAPRARVAACVAIRQAAAGMKNEAEASLAAAKSALAEVGKPPVFPLPGVKETLDASPPDASPLRMAAQAAAEIAHAEAALGKSADALSSLATAFDFARGIGPPPLEIRARVEAADNTPDAVRSQLRTQLKLATNDEVRLAFNAYRTKCDRLLAAGDLRLNVQGTLVARLIDTPLRAELWPLIQKSQATPDPLFETAAPWELMLASRLTGDGKDAEIEQALTAGRRAANPEHSLRLAVARLIAAGKPDEAAAEVEKSMLDPRSQAEVALVACCRLVKAGQVEPALRFIKGLRRDIILREEAYESAAALATRLGHGRTIWSAPDAKGLLPSEKVALYRGFVAGAVAVKETE